MLWTTDTYGMIRGVELGSSSVLAPSDNILIAQNSDEKFFEAVNIQVVKSVLFFGTMYLLFMDYILGNLENIHS